MDRLSLFLVSSNRREIGGVCVGCRCSKKPVLCNRLASSVRLRLVRRVSFAVLAKRNCRVSFSRRFRQSSVNEPPSRTWSESRETPFKVNPLTELQLTWTNLWQTRSPFGTKGNNGNPKVANATVFSVFRSSDRLWRNESLGTSLICFAYISRIRHLVILFIYFSKERNK